MPVVFLFSSFAVSNSEYTNIKFGSSQILVQCIFQINNRSFGVRFVRAKSET